MWIIGSSIIKGARFYSFTRPGGSNLSLERFGIRIWWQGYSGMKFRQLKSKVKTMLAYEDPPSILIFHCGGNDIGHIPLGGLRYALKSQVTEIQCTLPNTMIVFSQILPRHSWRYSNNTDAMERSRVRLNSAVATHTVQLGVYL